LDEVLSKYKTPKAMQHQFNRSPLTRNMPILLFRSNKVHTYVDKRKDHKINEKLSLESPIWGIKKGIGRKKLVWRGYQYVVFGAFGFFVWILFFDTNSFLYIGNLKQITSGQNRKVLHDENSKGIKVIIEKFSDPRELEKFAREQYYLKKKK